MCVEEKKARLRKRELREDERTNHNRLVDYYRCWLVRFSDTSFAKFRAGQFRQQGIEVELATFL